MIAKRRAVRIHRSGVPLGSRSRTRPAAHLQPDMSVPGPGIHRKLSHPGAPPGGVRGRHALVPEPRQPAARPSVLFRWAVLGLAVITTGTLIAVARAGDAPTSNLIESGQALTGTPSPALSEEAVASESTAIPQAGRDVAPEPLMPRAVPPSRDQQSKPALPVRKVRKSASVHVPERGTGEFRVVAGAGAGLTAADLSGTTSYRIEVERGVPIRAGRFADSVDQTLSDRRSWAGEGSAHPLARSDGAASFRIVLASPDTTDQLCAPLDTGGRVSCRNGDDVVINAWRWVNGAESYRGELRAYRRYLVNHEVGHVLGNGHASCPGLGRAAPVMVQQTYGLDGCSANPWPQGTDLRG